MIKLEKNYKKIGVIGLGYVGLPTAIAFFENGFKVVGIDIVRDVIDKIQRGESPLIDSSENLSIPPESERWSVSSDFRAISDCDIILITVPTPVSQEKKPDLKFVKSAARSVMENLDRGANKVLVLESTVYPGVTREILGGIRDDIGLSEGSDVTLAYCPERVNPGTAMGVTNLARVIGCDDVEVGNSLAKIYSQTTSGQCKYVGKMEVAEASKLVENLQRDIDIALANELAVVLPRIGVDVEEVLAAAETKWNFHRHSPGIGVGGHCIPVDPYYYISIADSVGYESSLSKSAREVNEGMPEFACEEISEIISREQVAGRVLVLGYSYKPELGDIRETPVSDLVKGLLKRGLEVLIWDPIVSSEDLPEEAIILDSPYESRDCGIMVLATAHEEVLNLDWEMMKREDIKPIIYDGRRVLDREMLESLGWEYYGIGLPRSEEV